MSLHRTTGSRLRTYLAVGLASIIAASTVSTAASAATTPKSGGEATVAIPQKFAGFCFTTTTLVGPTLGAASSIMEPLFTKTPTGQAVGLLAQTATPSADFKTWTITLRPNISFTNGQAFNADAVIENLDIIRGAKYLTGGAAKLWTLSGGVAALANVLSVRKIDDLNVGIDLFKPQNDLDVQLTNAYIRASASLATSSACVNNPIGTGPFTLSSWTPDELVVVRNPNYWRKDPNRPTAKLPYLDKIVFLTVQEGSQRAAAVRKGTVDAALMWGKTENTFIKDLKLRKSAVKVTDTPIHYFPSLWLNQGNGGPFSDINARKAIVHCIDRVNFNKVRLKGQGEAPKSIVGSQNILYNPSGYPAYDTELSKTYVAQYLAANPTKTSLSFTTPFNGTTTEQANAMFLKNTFAKCNITMNIVTEDDTVWAAKAFNVLTGKNAYDMVFTGLITETDAAINFPYLATNAFPTDSTNPLKIFRGTLGYIGNLGKHSDTKVDDLLWQARAATTPADVKAAYKAVTAEIQSQALFTSVVNFRWAFVTNNKSKLAGVGTLQVVKGKKVRPVTAQGADWAGLHKG
ncbi:MAG: hypothetical protein RLZZ526_523 [Actinomycetota bacterium]|jgi:ABC-type transport system substrate-binding protein